ncbi:hypothetical protein GLOIN_2v1761875 [Rhizophagus clarus]|uniref:Uncharacterized protein n=1 Tax=Rhizophagus clarus TaxID=94130 RepID=A0A8H3LQH5_9GLOM|nr:hypothetical protein GLOIN_2v1761875 [Rhizophagus clarus]
MFTITTKFVKDYNLVNTSEVNLEELSRYALEILKLLTTGDPLRLGLEAEVNISQVSDSTCSEETIKEMAQHIICDNLSERGVKAVSRILIETASSPISSLSCLSRFRRELESFNAPKKIISATLILEQDLLINHISLYVIHFDNMV